MDRRYSTRYFPSEIVRIEDINNIHRGKSSIDRFWEKVDRQHDDLCWNWKGAKLPTGYGHMRIKHFGYIIDVYAHRFAYIIEYKELKNSLTIDHLCRNHSCVNYSHLEAISQRENILRGESQLAKKAQQTHCIRGHIFDERNTYIAKNGTRKCRACLAKWQREYKAKIRESLS